MILYNLKGKNLSLIESESFRLEKDIQKIIENNTEELFGLRFMCSEFKSGEFRFDSVCFDEEEKSFVIIEYKKDYSFSIVDQGFSYLSTMLQNKSDFILEYNEMFNENLKKNQVDWSQTRIIFISPSFTSHQKNSINFKNLPFELWEIKKYSNDIVSLNQFVSSSKENINDLIKNPVISNVTKEIKVYDLNDLLSDSSKDIKYLWDLLNEKISNSNFYNTKFIDRKNYRRFCYENGVVICYINFRKNYIKLRIMGGTIYGDGTKGRNYVELDDYKNITKKIEKVWVRYGKRHGQKEGKDPVNISYDVLIDNDKNINYIVDLLKQRYESIVIN